ncbi:unnamed protein product [Didymodactylos carnosus]|uniref:EF-hand domain-containing protein n=2 Tax=Didymodactylos carnosus TaxID=1234261 RepID=A0A8S2K2T2_9BILA|nr:unnamed protein product [Didymodactylos carnosus]CAF3835410.1 unnamed protein product [Didymodactylos carnosus]
MSNYSYSSYQSSSGGGAGGYGGFDVAKAMFTQADVNRDGTIDQNEFQQWASDAAHGGAGGYGQSSSGYGYDSSSSGFGAGEADLSGGYAGSGYGSGAAGFSGYDSSSAGYSSGGISGHGGGQGFGGVSGSNLYQDSNPQIIRRPAPGGGVTYKQNILVRFLQPPPIPPPGPLIIREVRPPQPPALPPLRIRQQPPPRPAPPPLILRERPPVPPASLTQKIIIRRLPALPVPPRSVIIERLPPLPPKPRDIIIERWIPYGRQAKRRTIVQRANAAQQYARPRNIIIQYEPIQARVVRQFQRLGVQQENPQSYVQRYGASLQDAASLLQAARQAGVVEDISVPGGAAIGFWAVYLFHDYIISQRMLLNDATQSYGQDVEAGAGFIGHSGGAQFAQSALSGGAQVAQSAYSSQQGYDTGFEGGFGGASFGGSSFGGSPSGFESAGGYESQGGYGIQGGLSSSGYESSQSFGGAAVGADQFESQGASFQGGYDSGLGGHQVSASSFESSSFGGGFDAGSAGFGGSSGSGAAGSSSGYGVGYDVALGGVNGSAGFGGQLSSSSYGGSAGGQGGYGGVGGEASYAGISGGFDPVAAAFRIADVNRDGHIDQNEFRQFFRGGL